MTERTRRAIDWCFRDRHTGGYTIAQVPNLSLGIFLAATAVRVVFVPAGTVGTIVSWTARIALLWWATDEIVRGVNPWRRALGVAAASAALGSVLLSR